MSSRRVGPAAVLLAALLLIGWWLIHPQPPAPVSSAPSPAQSVTPPESEPDRLAPLRARPLLLTPSRAVPSPTHAAGAFSGRVQSAQSGAGVSGAELTFESGGAAFSARTDATGHFEFSPSRPGEYRLAAITAPAHLPFGPEWGHSPVTLASVPGQRVDGLVFFLTPALALRGVVLTPEGQPVPGASVHLEPQGQGAVGPSDPGPFLADAQGEFTFRGGEGMVLVATHPDHASARAVVGPRALLGERVRLILAPPGSIRPAVVLAGVVRDPHGQPVPDALVTATRRLRLEERSAGEAELPPASTVSDPEGRFRLRGLEPGRYDLRASLSGGGRGELKAITAPREDLVLSLLRGARVYGTVRAAEDGAPVAGFTVDLQRMRGALGRDGYLSTAVIGPDGRFELEAVAPGRYSLQVAAHGFALSEERELRVSEPPAEVGPIELSLQRGGRVHGVVLSDADGRPLAGALVSLEGGISASSTALPVMASTTTDAAGRFTLGGLAEGLRSITAMASGHHGRVLSGLRVENDGSIGPLQVRLTPVEPGEEPTMELVGIGAVLTTRGDALQVGRVIAGGGAAEAGLQEGDLLLQVDGVRVAALGFEGAVNRIRGPEGSSVVLVLKRGEAAPVERVVFRRRVRG